MGVLLRARMQASLATVHNLWIAAIIGAGLAAFLWLNAPLLIQGAPPLGLCGKPSPAETPPCQGSIVVYCCELGAKRPGPTVA